MSSCSEYSDHIKEYALGDIAELTPEDKAKLEARLAQCEDCRQELQSTKELLELVRESQDVKVPQEVKDALTAGVRRAIQKDAHWRTLCRIVLSGAIAAAVAVVALICLRNLQLPLQPPASDYTPGKAQAVTVTQNPIVPPSPRPQSINHEIVSASDTEDTREKPALQEEFNRISEAPKAIDFLNALFAATQANPDTAVLEEILSLAETVGSRWPQSPEAIEAIRLISAIYERIGEHHQWRDRLIDYADAYRTLKKNTALAQGIGHDEAIALGDRATLHVLTQETNRLFRARDYTSAVSFYDAIRIRWPRKEVARHAHFMTARCYGDSGQYAHAKVEFMRIIEDDPNSKWATQARTFLPAVLANLGQRREAAQMWHVVAETSTDHQLQASALYNEAVNVMLLGEQHYPEAVRILTKITKEYPDARCAEAVAGVIKGLHERIAGTLATKLIKGEE